MSVASLPGFAGKHFRRHVSRACPEYPPAENLPGPDTRTTPRSISLSDPSLSRMMLSGLISRWMMPARCSAAAPRASLIVILRPSSRPTSGTAREPRRQQFALIERHDGVETGLPPRRQFDDPADPGAVHARADPGLADEGRVIGGDRGDLRLGKFQRHLAALDFVDRAEQTGVAAVGHQHLEHETVDRLAVDRHRDQRQLHDGGADIGRFHRRQLDDVDHQRRAIIGAAGVERGRHQRARGIVGAPSARAECR